MTAEIADTKIPGALMRAESAQAAGVFADTVLHDVPAPPLAPKAIYTVARGSSDAAACILWYEFMSELRIPMTSLPPSAFSLMEGVDLSDAMALVISQSGGSDDLVRSARGAKARGAYVAALLNAPDSAVGAEVDLTVPIGAGPELAVPATKSVIGSVAAGMALLAAMKPLYGDLCRQSAHVFLQIGDRTHPRAQELRAALLRSQHVYVIGRGSGLGAAQEVALKLKETCALHAEAYSASEVLHGPLQLVTKPLLVLLLDTGASETSASIDAAEARFRDAGSSVFRISPRDLTAELLPAPAAAALILDMLYPVILETALALGFDPDHPENLAKVTRTI